MLLYMVTWSERSSANVGRDNVESMLSLLRIQFGEFFGESDSSFLKTSTRGQQNTKCRSLETIAPYVKAFAKNLKYKDSVYYNL